MANRAARTGPGHRRGSVEAASAHVGEAIAVVDRALRRLERIDSPLARAGGLTILKARNLAHAMRILCIEGLAQEAGGLLRNLIEANELAAYIRISPEHLREALEDRLPPAGVRARRIGGSHKSLREYLNRHAAHVSLSFESTIHLIDVSRSGFRLARVPSAKVVRTNLGMLYIFVVSTAFEAIRCLAVVSREVPRGLAAKAEALRDGAHERFPEFRPFLDEHLPAASRSTTTRTS